MTAKTDRKLSAEHRAKLSAALRGKKRGPHSPETRAKMRAAKIGKPHSPEHIANAVAAKAAKRAAAATTTAIGATP